MKHALWFVTMIGLFVLPLAAEAQFPKPKAAGGAPAVIAPPAPTPPAPPPPVVTEPACEFPPLPPQGWTQMDVLMWLWTLLGSVFAGVFTKNSFWPTKPPVGGGVVPAVNSVTDLLKTVDGKLRPVIDQALFRVVVDALNRGEIKP